LPALAAALLTLGARPTGAGAAGPQPYQLFQRVLKRRRLLARPAVAASFARDVDGIAGMVGTYLEHLRSTAHAVIDAEGERGAVAALVGMRQGRHKADVAAQALATFVATGVEPPVKAASTLADAKALGQRLAALEKARNLPCTCSHAV
jgi:hypothetical protein